MSAPPLDCRECRGEGCEYCDGGRAYCDEPACFDHATESLDPAPETGSPSDWLVCEKHGKEIRQARRDREDAYDRGSDREPVAPYADEDLDARTDEAVEP